MGDRCDDLSGEFIDASEVRAARMEETEFMKEIELCQEVDRLQEGRGGQVASGGP